MNQKLILIFLTSAFIGFTQDSIAADQKEQTENIATITIPGAYNWKKLEYLSHRDSYQSFLNGLAIEVTVTEMINSEKHVTVKYYPFSAFYLGDDKFVENNQTSMVYGLKYKLSTNLNLKTLFESMKKSCCDESRANIDCCTIL